RKYVLPSESRTEYLEPIVYPKGADFRINTEFYKAKTKDYFGFEFRFLDLFKLEYMGMNCTYNLR
ncbi:unnamed protein product, partial [marine sediment metagenome]